MGGRKFSLLRMLKCAVWKIFSFFFRQSSAVSESVTESLSCQEFPALPLYSLRSYPLIYNRELLSLYIDQWSYHTIKHIALRYVSLDKKKGKMSSVNSFMWQLSEELVKKVFMYNTCSSNPLQCLFSPSRTNWRNCSGKPTHNFKVFAAEILFRYHHDYKTNDLFLSSAASVHNHTEKSRQSSDSVCSLLTESSPYECEMWRMFQVCKKYISTKLVHFPEFDICGDNNLTYLCLTYNTVTINAVYF